MKSEDKNPENWKEKWEKQYCISYRAETKSKSSDDN